MSENANSARRRAVIIVAAAAVGAVIGTALLTVLPGQDLQRPVQRVDTSPVDIGGPFTLTAHTGETVSDTDFRGRSMLVYFGFTYCPDVCPLTLQTLGDALEELGPDAERFQPLLISVDPGRDTPEALGVYVASNGFPDNLIGLTGTEAEIRAAADAYRVDYWVIEDDDSYAEYLMEHTNIVFLMDENGDFVSPLTHDFDAPGMAARLRRHLAESDAGA